MRRGVCLASAAAHVTRNAYQPPPPPPPPPPPDPPPPDEKPDEPDDAGMALDRALLVLATVAATALPKLAPDQAPLCQAG
jgi:hypothetical protein